MSSLKGEPEEDETEGSASMRQQEYRKPGFTAG